jgi:hypothetical protein
LEQNIKDLVCENEDKYERIKSLEEKSGMVKATGKA